MWKLETLTSLTLGILACVALSSGQSQDLKCYTCVTQAGDNTCLEDPDRVTTLPVFDDCDGGWCKTTRKEFTEVPGKIVTFTRECSLTKPEYLDNIIHNAHFTTYYTTCRTQRCNNGDGLKENSGDNGGGDNNSGLIIVNGESSGERMVKVNTAFAVISTFIGLLIIY